jgi:hypothetical protein
MTLKAWGHTRVSSALEVFAILTAPPDHPEYHALWQQLLAIEPPFWGSLMEHAPAIACLRTRAYRVWSWDDHGAVLSPESLSPPLGVRYRTWDFLRHERDDPPTDPRRRPLSASTRIHVDTETWPSTEWPNTKP